MKIMEYIKSKLKLTSPAKEEKVKILTEIRSQSVRTTVSLNRANNVLKRNITITHNIARAMGVLNGSN